MLWKLNYSLRIVCIFHQNLFWCVEKKPENRFIQKACHNACIAERYIEAIFCAQSIFVLIGAFFCSGKIAAAIMMSPLFQYGAKTQLV